MEKSKTKEPHLLLCILLVIATLAVYWHVTGYGFVDYDDDAYVWTNSNILRGLDTETVKWAFTASHASNWHPLTWLSLAADMQLTKDNCLPTVGDKTNAKYFHITNLLLHIANVLLLYLVLFRATGHAWRGAFVAALFAVHPLHVESVAWVTERKDVLSTLFWLLTMLAYMSWVNRRGWARYALMIGLYALGLMSKPMLVSLPLVLLMMDWWPLGRLKGTGNRGQGTPNPQHPTPITRLVIEKLPLFALAIASSIVTYWVQSISGAAGSLVVTTFSERAANAVVAYTGYIVKMFWPAGLAAFYPHPMDSLPVWQVVGSTVIFAALCWLAVRCARSRPYVTVGWLWYVITLVPVIGLVQVGRQAAADRYTYVPLIGLFVAIAWLIPELLPRKEPLKRKKQPVKPRMGLAVCAVAAILAYGTSGYVQTTYWNNSSALFSRMLDVTRDNYVAYSQFGNALCEENRHDEAIEYYQKAISIKPDFSDALVNLGLALVDVGRIPEAIEHYREAARINPNETTIRNNMGYALIELNDLDGAEREFLTALEIDPNDTQAHNNLGVVCARRGDLDGAVREFSLALEGNPDSPEIRSNLDSALAARFGNR